MDGERSPTSTAPRAVVLLSGGLDSTTVLAIAKSRGFEPCALSFRYGQRHAIELDSARRVAQAFGVRNHVVAEIDLRVFGGSSLTGDDEVPTSTRSITAATRTAAPSTSKPSNGWPTWRRRPASRAGRSSRSTRRSPG